MMDLTETINFFKELEMAQAQPTRRERREAVVPGVRGAGNSLKRSGRARQFGPATDEEVRLRAYELWERTGNSDAFVNWVTAERQLSSERKRY